MISASLVLFYVAGALTLGGALAVVLTRNIVYAAFALLASLMGVAGAEFLALVQVLIYGGAIVIVILFSLMLTRIEDFRVLSDNRQWPFAALAALGVFALLAAAIVGTSVRTVDRRSVDFETLGETLFVQWAVPFEVASLVLLVALIGAIVLVRTSGGRD